MSKHQFVPGEESDPCQVEFKEFNQCLRTNNNDLNICQVYELAQCRDNHMDTHTSENWSHQRLKERVERRLAQEKYERDHPFKSLVNKLFS